MDMKTDRKVITDKAAIADWEDEGGALKPLFIPEVMTNNKVILICIGCLVVLPFFYWLAKK